MQKAAWIILQSISANGFRFTEISFFDFPYKNFFGINIAK
jgi:hypothetical protein